MTIWVHSGGTYLVEKNTKNRVGGHFFLSDFIKDADEAEPKLNIPIHTLCEILKIIT